MPTSVFTDLDNIASENAIFNRGADASGIHFVLDELDVSMNNIAASILGDPLQVIPEVDVVVPLKASVNLFKNYFVVSVDGTDVSDGEVSDIMYNEPTLAADTSFSDYLEEIGDNFRSKDVSAGRIQVVDMGDTTVGANYVRFIVEKMFGNANLVDLINNESVVRNDISFTNLHLGVTNKRELVAEKLWNQLMKAGENDNHERLQDLSGDWKDASFANTNGTYTSDTLENDRHITRFPFRVGDTFSFTVTFNNSNTTITGQTISGKEPGKYKHRVVIELIA